MNGEGRSEERRIGLVPDPAKDRLQARIVLDEKLEHPGIGVFLRHRVGDEVLEPRAEAPEVLRTLAVGRGGPDLEEGPDAPAVGQREGLVLGQVLRPGQEVREGFGRVVDLPDPGPGDGATASGLAGKEMWNRCVHVKSVLHVPSRSRHSGRDCRNPGHRDVIRCPHG